MKLNKTSPPPAARTHGGGPTSKVSHLEELRRAVMTCLLWEDTFYESGSALAKRIEDLCKVVEPADIATLAREARNDMHLRHVPLFLVRQLAKRAKETIQQKKLSGIRTFGVGELVADTLYHVIQRADEMGEFLAMYQLEGADKPIASSVKRGLREAFFKFNEYQLAKYDRDSAAWKLRDVMRLVHPRPTSPAQSELFKKVVSRTLETPDTWEVELSAGKDKKATFERLLREKKLGGLAVLRNLRNMVNAGVDLDLVRERLKDGIAKALPFRFIAAAKYAPKLEDEIGAAMIAAAGTLPKLTGTTLLVVDISGSMGGILSAKSEMHRLDAACGLAILLRECSDTTVYATAGDDGRQTHATGLVPARHGFALSDSIRGLNAKLGRGGIFLVQCMDYIAAHEPKSFDRVIVLTDEQDCDHKANPASAKRLGTHNYIINIGTYQNGIAYNSNWTHINGWSERVVDYIQALEAYEGVPVI